MRATNAAGLPHFCPTPSEEVKVHIRPDSSVSLGMFAPDPLYQGHYKAHPTTIAAMRKDIFFGGSSEFEDLQQLETCEKCHHELDYQFWSFCPYCEAPLEKN